MSVSTCNAIGLPFLVPGIDFFVVELPEIEIVEESLVDCVCFADTVISLSEALFCTGFTGKSVLLEVFSKNYWFLLDPTYPEC